MSGLHTLLLVMAGGALGAGARFLIGDWLLRQLGSGFPWGTFAVNLLGSFGAGLLLGVDQGLGLVFDGVGHFAILPIFSPSC